MKSAIVSLGLFSHAGGPTKTIDCFKQALDAELYAFCEQRTLKQYGLPIKGAHPVVSSSLPVLSQFCYTRKGARKAAAALVDTDMVSCHSFYRYHALWTRDICKAAGVPYWFVPHGILDPWVMQKNRWVKQLYWRFGGQDFLEHASTVIFSTRAERDKAASQFALPESEVIPWAVDLVDRTDYENIRVQIRKKLSIPEKAHVLLYFGRLHPVKRSLETIEIIAKANSEKTHLMIVGNEDGVTEVDCMQLARKHGVEERVHFIGAIYGETKYHYMHAADAYISLSFKENFNHTAAESLAAGLPVILSPGNDLRGDLSGAGCCLNIEDDTLRSAIEVVRAFNDLSLSKLQEMGMRGRKWVEENLSFDLFKTRLLELRKRYAKK